MNRHATSRFFELFFGKFLPKRTYADSNPKLVGYKDVRILPPRVRCELELIHPKNHQMSSGNKKHCIKNNRYSMYKNLEKKGNIFIIQNVHIAG